MDASVDAWPMYHHDPQHTGFSTSSVESLDSILWGVGLDNHAGASLAIVDNCLYIGGGSPNGSVYCFNATNGREIWQYDTPDEIGTAPAVVDGKVYVGCFNGVVYCLDAYGDGQGSTTVIWTYTTADHITSSPLVVNGKVYIGSWDYYLYCLDAEGNGDGTTTVIWNKRTDGAIMACPSYYEGNIYIGSFGGTIYCYNADNGLEIWTYHIYGGVSTSAAVVDGKVYTGADDRTFYCLDAFGDGHGSTTVLWSFPSPGVFTTCSPAVAYGKVYVGSSETSDFFCLNANNGSLVWNYAVPSEGFAYITTSPAIADGKVFFGAYDNSLHCLSAENGTSLWEYKLNFIFTAPVIYNGKVYAGFNWYLLCFGHTPKPAFAIGAIQGGFNVTTEITNIGDGFATAARWDIFIRGGIFGFIDIHDYDTKQLAVNETMLVTSTSPIHGIGRVTVTVIARTSEVAPLWTEVQGFVLGRHIFILDNNVQGRGIR